jgi:hypothetical protein
MALDHGEDFTEVNLTNSVKNQAVVSKQQKNNRD